MFSAAPETGEDIFVIFLGVAFDTTTLLATGAITGQTAETAVADDDLILIFDTSASALRKMTKANFAPSVSLSYSVNANLTGDGSTTAFTIGTASRSQNDLLVTVNGVVFHPGDDYTLSGTTLTFSTPPSASAEIRVRKGRGKEIKIKEPWGSMRIKGGLSFIQFIHGNINSPHIQDTKRYKTICAYMTISCG